MPDITNVQVQINTEAPGYSPLEAEQRITFPIETALAGLPRLEYTRSLSRYGLSQVTVVFEDGTDIYFARQLVNERVREAMSRLPEGLEPELGPIATGLGEIFMFTVEAAAGRDRRARRAVDADRAAHAPGLGDQAAAAHRAGRHRGEHDRRLREGDPRDAAARAARRARLTFRDLLDALARNSTSTGAGYIERNGEQYLVRAPGQLASLDDVRAIVVGHAGGVPIRVGDVAEVALGRELRTGAATENGREVVLGTVFMLIGENSRDVSQRGRRRSSTRSTASLPPGVVARDASTTARELVDRTIATVAAQPLEGALLVIAVLFAAARQRARGVPHRARDPARRC